MRDSAWMGNAIFLSCEIRCNMKYGKIWRKCELVGNNRLVADSCMNNFESKSRLVYFSARVLIGDVL